MPRWDVLILAKAQCGTVRSIGTITTREQIATPRLAERELHISSFFRQQGVEPKLGRFWVREPYMLTTFAAKSSLAAMAGKASEEVVRVPVDHTRGADRGRGR